MTSDPTQTSPVGATTSSLSDSSSALQTEYHLELNPLLGSWLQEAGFSERELKEMAFSVLYKQCFAHGTSGHTDKMLIAKLVACIDEVLSELARALVKLDDVGALNDFLGNSDVPSDPASS